MSAPPVPTSRTAIDGRAGRQPIDRAGAEVDAAEASVDPREIAQVADEGSAVVERAVEQLLDAGQSVHARSLPLARLVPSGGADGRRQACSLSAMPRRVRLPFIALAVALLTVAGRRGRGAGAPIYPHQSVGNRGSDVRALQGLLRHRRRADLHISGVFDAPTVAAVRAFQTAKACR